MQLSTHDGIMCDFCGAEHRQHFIYYSLDCCAVAVRDDSDGSSVRGLSVDLCPLCWGQLAERVRANWRPLARGRCCDLTGMPLVGTYLYHRGELALVRVNRGALQVERKFVELVLSPAAMAELTGRVRARPEESGQWSTSNA